MSHCFCIAAKFLDRKAVQYLWGGGGGGGGGVEYVQQTKFDFGSRFILVGQSLFSLGDRMT